MHSLQERVAVVTGGGNGIGRALALTLADAGAHVVVADLELDAAAEVAREVELRGRQALPLHVDVIHYGDVERMRERTLAEFGAVHVLCNNAGISPAGPSIVSAQLTDWQWAFNVNVMGVVHGLRAFLPALASQDEAHVVNTASTAAFKGGAYNGPYCASKAAVLSISETAYRELRAEGYSHVGVSVVCPSNVATTIGESERRRPEALRPRTPAAVNADMAAALARYRGTGMSPETVARVAIEAIRSNRFYVFTHDSTAVVSERTEWALRGLSPDSALD